MADAATTQLNEKLPPPVSRAPSPVVLGLLVMNLAVSGVVLFKLFTASPTPPQTEAEHHEGKDARHEGAPATGMGPTVKLADFVVHLRNPDAERYAKMSFELEVGAEPDKDRVNAHMPQVRELFISYLSDQTVDDLRGSEGIEKTKKELLARLTREVPDSMVRSVFVTDLVIQ